MKTLKEWANALSNREYVEEITNKEEQELKELGFVVVFGASDDSCEFRGAINDEAGCYYGDTINITKKGIFKSIHADDECDKIEAVWCDPSSNFAWTYKTEIPHERFNILEDGAPYCEGIIFDIKSLRDESNNKNNKELIDLLLEAAEEIQNLYGHETDLSERLLCKAKRLEGENNL